MNHMTNPHQIKNLAILNKKQAKSHLSLVEKRFGCQLSSLLDRYGFLLSPENKFYLINKELGQIDTPRLKVDRIGLYFGQERNGEIRLSLEGSQLVGPHSTKNNLLLNKTELSQWFDGQDIELNRELNDKKIKIEDGFIILNHKDKRTGQKDFIGCGKLKLAKKRIFNYLPKERRIALTKQRF